MLAAWPEEDQGLPEITARPSNRAGRYFVLRSSSCSLSEICGRTSNKITRWPSKFTTPRSTPGTHTPRQWMQLSWLERRQRDIETIELNRPSCQERTELINVYIDIIVRPLRKMQFEITRSIADGSI